MCVLLRQNYACRDRYFSSREKFFTTSILLSRQETCFVVTKMILVAASASDSLPLARTLTSITVLAFSHEHSCLQAATGGDGPSDSLPLARTLTSITVLAFSHEHSCLQAATGGDGPNVIVEMLSNVNLQHDLEMIKFQGRILVSAEIIYFGPFFFFLCIFMVVKCLQ